MRILITIMLLWSSAIAFSQEIWQLSPWAPDSSYVIGAYPSGEPKWVKVDSLGVADSIYLSGDTIRLRDGSGSVILPCEQVYEIFIDKFTGVYTYPSGPVACGAFGYCEDPRTLFYYDGETWNIMVRDARITTSDDYPDKDEVIPLENADIYIDQDTTWFFTWENGWQIFSTKFKTDTSLITQIISDSLANITTEPDSIQRSGNIISLRDGSGSVNVSDLVNVADSTSVLNSYGTIITETTANTYNVKVDSSLFATTYDITQKQNIITGTSGQTLRFDGTNTLIANSLLYNVGNQIGIGTITPTASYILDVAGNTKVRDGFLTVDGTVFINASNTLNMYNAANTGIFHSYQDGATSTDNIVYRGQHKTFTIGYNAGAGQSYANVANKKLHINGAVSIGDGVSATSVAANSLLVEGSATVQDRTGTATTLGGFDTNGKLVGVSLGTGLSWSGSTLNGNVGNVIGSGVATRVAFWNGTNSLSSTGNLRSEPSYLYTGYSEGIHIDGSNTSYASGIKFRNEGYAHCTFGMKGNQFVFSNTSANHAILWATPTDHLKINMSSGVINVPNLAGSDNRMVIANSSGDLSTQSIPTSPQTWGDFTSNIQSWNSTGTFGSGKDVGIGGQPTQDFDVNGNARLRGAIYNSSNSAGTTGQVLTSQGTGSWIWSTPTTNLSYSVKSGTDVYLESSSGADVILRDGDGTVVNRVASNVVSFDAAGAQFAQLQAGSFDWVSQTMSSSFTKIDYGQTYFNGVSANATTDQITINATGDYEITYCGCTILSSGTTTKINLQLFLNNSSTGVFLGNSKHVLANECFSKSYMKYLTSGTTVDLRFAKDNGDSTSIFWDSHSLTVKRIR